MGNIWSVVIFFLVAASLGATLLTFVLKDKKRPMALAVAHGLFAISAFSIFTYYLASNVGVNNTLMNTAYLFFCIAILGGVTMFIIDKILKKHLPKFAPFLHAGAAATGLVLLMIFAFTQS